MIIGTGIDTVEISRIRRALGRFGDHFINRLFTPYEQAEARRLARPERFLAARFSAKEAMSKALGTGMAQGVTWQDIGVEKRPSGQPFIVLTGRAALVCEGLLPAGYRARIHLSLTDTQDSAQSLVLFSAVAEVDQHRGESA